MSGTPDSIGRQMLSINPRKIVQSRETSNVSIGPITDVSQSQESKSRTDVSKALTRRQTEFRAQVAHRIALRGLWIHPQWSTTGRGRISSVRTWRIIFLDNFGRKNTSDSQRFFFTSPQFWILRFTRLFIIFQTRYFDRVVNFHRK